MRWNRSPVFQAQNPGIHLSTVPVIAIAGILMCSFVFQHRHVFTKKTDATCQE